jgi:hypothetical protein
LWYPGFFNIFCHSSILVEPIKPGVPQMIFRYLSLQCQIIFIYFKIYLILSFYIILILLLYVLFRVWIHRNCIIKDTIIKIKIIFGMLEVY